ncbi:glycosyltransferase [Cetobacterium somerae]|uniref:glycosyltransferase n=1 Tax=Cetobacterium somerae TaxID=188913 RepID=UPI00211F0954|nr:glycosyltransferase [Cetobacterium somerae]MCQ9628386.1 glycosyltransferase [Cetobacterium somerae]
MKFSVLMSLYDKEKPEYLDEALNSISINQDLKPNEIILVLDGPINDKLRNVIDKYKKKITNLKVLKLDKNMGLGLALREGLNICENNLVFRMDTDDISHRERFKKQVEFFKRNPEIKILGTNAIDFDVDIKNELNYRKFPQKNREIKKFSKRRCPFLHPTVGFYKDIILEVGSYRDLLFFEDYDLFLRILNKYKGYNLQENLLYFRSNINVFKRRGGINYLKFEYKALKKFEKEKLMNKYYFFTNLLIRVGFRICGNKVRSKLYKKILRKDI